MEVSDEEVDKINALIRDIEKGAETEEKQQPYQYSAVPVEIVEKDIDEYIIPELQDSCKALWAKNIFTFMCSNRNDGGDAYIILDGKLSAENQAIFDSLRKKNPENLRFAPFRGGYRLQLLDAEKLSQDEISQFFMQLVSHFKMQDVQENFYQTSEAYLLDKCGCYDEIPNPDYIADPGPMPTTLDLNELDAWFKKCNSPKTIRVFNKDKMTKSLQEYVDENGDAGRFDAKTGRVYTSPYFLQKHLDYAKTIEVQAE